MYTTGNEQRSGTCVWTKMDAKEFSLAFTKVTNLLSSHGECSHYGETNCCIIIQRNLRAEIFLFFFSFPTEKRAFN